MSIVTIETTISRRSLRNKSKDDLIDMVLQYADVNGSLNSQIALLEARAALPEWAETPAEVLLPRRNID